MTLTVKWHRKGADQGNAPSQYTLGVMYNFGNGVEQDYAEAYAWCNIAAESLPEAAHLRGELGKLMSPQQLGEAQKRTRDLKALIEAKTKSQ